MSSTIDPDALYLDGMDQLQSRISSLDPLGVTNISTKRDVMNGQACRQIA
jgi:hypothetical protein